MFLFYFILFYYNHTKLELLFETQILRNPKIFENFSSIPRQKTFPGKTYSKKLSPLRKPKKYA